MRRAARRTDLANGQQQSSVDFVSCRQNECERRSASDITREFTFGDSSASASRLWVNDHQASVVALTDSAASVVGRNTYDPWGRISTTGDSALKAFAGLIPFDGDRSIAIHRVFDAAIGRWTSEDPAGRIGGANLYRYVENNPIRYWDPTGLIKWKCGVHLAAAMTFPTAVGINATCTSECVGGRQLTQTLAGAGTGGSYGLPASYSYAEYTLSDDFSAPTTFSLPGRWHYSGAAAAYGVLGWSKTSLTLGGATSGTWSGDFEAGLDLGLDAFSGFTVPISSRWSQCSC